MIKPACKQKRPYLIDLTNIQVKSYFPQPQIKSCLPYLVCVGESITLHCEIIGEHDSVQLIGLKYHNNQITESDLSFPSGTLITKITKESTEILHKSEFVAYVIRVSFKQFAKFKVHFVTL